MLIGEPGVGKTAIVEGLAQLREAARLADRIEAPAPGLSQSTADLASIRQLCKLPSPNIVRK